jgi:hypothetical protein
MKSILTNEFKKTYTKRDVDSRLRVLYEKQVSLQTTNPATYVVVDIQMANGGTGYEVDDILLITGTTIEIKVLEVNNSGSIIKVDWDKGHTYDTDPGTIIVSNGTSAGDKDDPDDILDTSASITYISGSNNGNFARVIIATRYAPGDHASYGDLGHATIHDPLVQESRMAGYINEKLEDVIAMHFIGFISEFEPLPRKDAITPTGPNAYRTVVLEEGNLWLMSSIKPPQPNDLGTGDIAPETAKPDSNFSSNWLFGTNILRWDGKAWLVPPVGDKWYGQKYYKPEKLDLWSNLNIQKYDQDNNSDTNGNNNGIVDDGGNSSNINYDNDTNMSTPNGTVQNTGWYWFDGWRLFNFSIDETRFVHLDGDEVILGWKTFRIHPDVPATSYWVDNITDNPGAHGRNGPHTATKYHYATMAQIVSSTLLLSSSNAGVKQNVGGITKFSGSHYIGSFDSPDDGPIESDKKQSYDNTLYHTALTPTSTQTVFVVGPRTLSEFRNIVRMTEATPTESNSIGTGALVISGGVGIGLNLNVGGNSQVFGTSITHGASVFNNTVTITNTDANYGGSEETTKIEAEQDGALRIKGGVNIGKRLIIRGSSSEHDAVYTPSNSETGALTVIGGVNIKKRVRIQDTTEAVYTPSTTGFGAISVSGGVDIKKRIQTHGTVIIDPDDAYDNIYDTGLRINQSSKGYSSITLGGSKGSNGNSNTSQLNIIANADGTGIGYDDSHLRGSADTAKLNNTFRASSLFIMKGENNPYIRGTQIPTLSFVGGDATRTNTTTSTTSSNQAIITDVVTTDPPFVLPSSYASGNFYVPKITVNNRGMITELTQTNVRIPQKYAGVVDSNNSQRGLISLTIQSTKPSTTTDTTGDVNNTNYVPRKQTSDNYAGWTGMSTVVARWDHIHPSDTYKANLSGATFTGVVKITDSTSSTSVSTGCLIVSGGVGVGGTVTATNFVATSSRAVKENIESFKNSALDIISDINIVSYDYKDAKDKVKQIGFIAEDTNELLAGKTHTNMRINSCIGLLLKAIQELNNKLR